MNPPFRTHTGKSGWLIRSSDGGIVVVRRLINVPQALVCPLEDGKSDPQSLHLLIHGGEFASELVLDVIERAVAGAVDLSERFIAVLAEQAQDPKLHRCLKNIDRVADGRLLDFTKVLHRIIPYAARVDALERKRARLDLVGRVASEMRAGAAE